MIWCSSWRRGGEGRRSVDRWQERLKDNKGLCLPTVLHNLDRDQGHRLTLTSPHGPTHVDIKISGDSHIYILLHDESMLKKYLSYNDCISCVLENLDLDQSPCFASDKTFVPFSCLSDKTFAIEIGFLKSKKNDTDKLTLVANKTKLLQDIYFIILWSQIFWISTPRACTYIKSHHI